MDILKYIIQGISHEIILFFNFIDFSYFFFIAIAVLLIIINIKKVYKSLISLFMSLFDFAKIPIVLIGIFIISGMYITTAFLFKDPISLYFIIISIISLFRDLKEVYNIRSLNSTFSFKQIIKTSISLTKGSLVVLSLRIINMIDIWNFESLKYIYVYFIYVFTLLSLIIFIKINIIIDNHMIICKLKGRNYSRFTLSLLYIYSLFYVKNFDFSSNMLLFLYRTEFPTTLKSDLSNIKKSSLKLKNLMKQIEIDSKKLRISGVDNYENKIQKNI